VPIVGAVIEPIRSEDAVINEIYLIVATEITRQAGIAFKPVVDEICKVFKVYLAHLYIVAVEVGGVKVYPANILTPGITG
jgi:hypothetical protein